jgi:predicted nucleic acid-binding protein
MIAVNTSPLIILGKQGRLDILKSCFCKMYIPQGVYKEIQHKKETPEALALEQAVQEGWVHVEKVKIMSLLDTSVLGQGEKEAISLASQQKKLLIIDDDLAKKYALIVGVEAHGILYVLLLACKKKICSQKEIQELLQAMMKQGFYLSTEVYLEFVNLLKKM